MPVPRHGFGAFGPQDHIHLIGGAYAQLQNVAPIGTMSFK